MEQNTGDIRRPQMFFYESNFIEDLLKIWWDIFVSSIANIFGPQCHEDGARDGQE